jgi:hypothetical protein
VGASDKSAFSWIAYRNLVGSGLGEHTYHADALGVVLLGRDALAAIMTAYGTVQNPLDVTGAAIIDPGIFTRSIEAMSADPSVGVIGDGTRIEALDAVVTWREHS